MALFNKLKEKGEQKAAKPSKFPVIAVEDNELYENIKSYAEKTEELDVVKTQVDSLNSEIKEEATTLFVKEMEKMGNFPGTVVVEAFDKNENKAAIQFIPTDKYLKCDAEKCKKLRKEYGEDVVEETDVVSIKDVALFLKYEKEIEKFLNKIGVEAEDMFKVETTYSVKKGSVGNMLNIAKQKKTSLSNVMQDLGVIVQLKSPQVAEAIAKPAVAVANKKARGK